MHASALYMINYHHQIQIHIQQLERTKLYSELHLEQRIEQMRESQQCSKSFSRSDLVSI